MALSLMTDPLFDQFLGGGFGRGRGRDLGSLVPSTDSLPALHNAMQIHCDVVERPDRYSIIAGVYLCVPSLLYIVDVHDSRGILICYFPKILT